MQVGLDPAVPRGPGREEIRRIVVRGKMLVAEFRMGGKKLVKGAAVRSFHKSHRDQAHPEQSDGVVILLIRAVVIGKATDAGGHTLGGASGIGGLQVEPGDAKMLPVVKLVGRKRKIFECPEKVFVAPGARAGAKVVIGHRCFGNRNVRSICSLPRWRMTPDWLKFTTIRA